MFYYFMYVFGRIRRLYFNQTPTDNEQYSKSRRAFTVDGVTASIIGTLVGGAYLSGYLKYIEIPDALNGIISAIPALCGLAQPLGALYAERIKKRKLFVSALAFIHRTLISFVFIVPLFVADYRMRITLLIICLVCVHTLASLIGPAASNWIASLVPQRLRGRYFGIRDFYTVIGAAAVSLIAGWLLDMFRANDMVRLGYIIFGLFIFIFTIINFISLSMVMEPEQEQRQEGLSLSSLLLPLKDKSFRPVLFMGCLWGIGNNIATPFWGIYLVGSMELPYMLISVVTCVCGILKALLVRRWGRFAGSRSWTTATRYAVLIIGFSHMALSFMVKSNTLWLYPLLSIISNIGWAEVAIGFLNIQFDYAPAKGRILYFGAYNSIVGAIGFLSVFIGAWITAMDFSGMQIAAQQILMMLSGLILVGCSIYTKRAVEKHKKLKNRTDGFVTRA